MSMASSNLTSSSNSSSFFEQSSNNADEEHAKAAIDEAIANFYSNETYNSAMKCTFRRSETNPDKYNVVVDVKQISQKQKRQLVLENCFEHCNCLQQLVELRRQKKNTFHQISMQYGGQASFQPPNLSKHIKHVRSRKSSSNASIFSSKKSSKKSNKK